MLEGGEILEGVGGPSIKHSPLSFKTHPLFCVVLGAAAQLAGSLQGLACRGVLETSRGAGRRGLLLPLHFLLASGFHQGPCSLPVLQHCLKQPKPVFMFSHHFQNRPQRSTCTNWLVARRRWRCPSPWIVSSKPRDSSQRSCTSPWRPGPSLAGLILQASKLSSSQSLPPLSSPRDGRLLPAAAASVIPLCSHYPATSYLVKNSSYLANSFSIKFSLLNPHVSSLSREECDCKTDSKGFTESKLERR